MSQFLWVEDFGDVDVDATATSVFGGILANQSIPDDEFGLKKLLANQGILLKLDFVEALEFIRNPEELLSIDYIILDISLSVDITKNIRTETDEYLQTLLQRYHADKQTACKELEKMAGYQLYVELIMEIGFPKEHILFCSNHAEELSSIANAFEEAKLPLPKIPTKQREEDIAKVQAWVKKNKENPYSVLRRGIINGCKHLQSLLENQQEAAIQFGEFVKSARTISVPDMQDYLETLQNILPLRQPDNPQRLYKLLVRSLAHEWDAAYPDNLPKCDQDGKDCFQARSVKSTFGWIMKHARNWAAHSTVLDQLTEQDVAFLFIVAMRAMFKLTPTTAKYETMLFNLFSAEISESIDTNEVRIFLAETYSDLKNKIVDTKGVKDGFHFSEMLNNLQNCDVYHDYKKGLFQMFWHGLSPVRLHRKRNEDRTLGKVSFVTRTNMVCTNYSFTTHDYGKTENFFLFELARSIYKRSFS
ncbi:MAG: hypothetical protein ABFS56_25950 [Pseudomonadota bacterium]